ncbi:transcriptional activator NhaR [Celerinatantimonas yamalensis]|uniref:Transcriptional activator NhaR n=1 Tax=Celerinatantimonas yamalensis TaxID=559956 RepID=A0ABW9GD50_9GAMM
MAHLNYNHLYYFWMTYKRGSVTAAAQALFLTPQTVTGQIKLLEERFHGALFIRKGPRIIPTELGQLVFKYADKMFSLSYEMLDIVNYTGQESLLFEVGVADALSKTLASKVLMSVMPQDGKMQLRCIESTHEMLLAQLSEHKLDMILSDCAIDSDKQDTLFSKWLGECGVAFFSAHPIDDVPFPACLEVSPLLVPSRRSALGRKLLSWFDEVGLSVSIMGEFDDAALMTAFGSTCEGIFVAPAIYTEEIMRDVRIHQLGMTDDIKEEYYVIFAQRMIQHPAVKRLCKSDFSELFAGLNQS